MHTTHKPIARAHCTPHTLYLHVSRCEQLEHAPDDLRLTLRAHAITHNQHRSQPPTGTRKLSMNARSEGINPSRAITSSNVAK
jgi:hypothetical protein